MQFKKSAVVGVLITLYLSTDSLCHYIPEKKMSSHPKKNKTDAEQIQICGNALTTLIIEACDGIVGSFSEANLSRESLQTKITEDCCDHECPLNYLQSYCGDTPLFTTKTRIASAGHGLPSKSEQSHQKWINLVDNQSSL